MRVRDPISSLCLALVTLASPLAAPTDAFVGDELVRAQLITERPHASPGTPFWVAVRLRMADGWHVNWLNPGDAGLAPTIRWALPEGWKAGEIQWPYPHRFLLPALAIYGYEHEVLLLVELTPPGSLRDGSVAEIGAAIEWLACREACVPGEATLRASIPVSLEIGPRESARLDLFDKARKELPTTSDAWGFDARIEGEEVVIVATPPEKWQQELTDVELFPAEPGIIEPSSEQEFEETPEGYRIVLRRALMGVEVPSRFRGVLVSKTGWGVGPQKALEIDVPLERESLFMNR